MAPLLRCPECKRVSVKHVKHSRYNLLTNQEEICPGSPVQQEKTVVYPTRPTKKATQQKKDMFAFWLMFGVFGIGFGGASFISMALSGAMEQGFLVCGFFMLLGIFGGLLMNQVWK